VKELLRDAFAFVRVSDLVMRHIIAAAARRALRKRKMRKK
jgi:hypothetical protein